jgi:hypothetical protein
MSAENTRVNLFPFEAPPAEGDITKPPRPELGATPTPSAPGAAPPPSQPLRKTNYFVDEGGITVTRPKLFFDLVLKELGYAATVGYIISDSTTIKISLNGGSTITLNIGEKFALAGTDPFSITTIAITSASATASIRIFMA